MHRQTNLRTRLNKVGEPAAIMSDTVDIAVVSAATTETLTALLIDTVSYKSYN